MEPIPAENYLAQELEKNTKKFTGSLALIQSQIPLESEEFHILVGMLNQAIEDTFKPYSRLNFTVSDASVKEGAINKWSKANSDLQNLKGIYSLVLRDGHFSEVVDPSIRGPLVRLMEKANALSRSVVADLILGNDFQDHLLQLNSFVQKELSQIEDANIRQKVATQWFERQMTATVKGYRLSFEGSQVAIEKTNAQPQ